MFRAALFAAVVAFSPLAGATPVDHRAFLGGGDAGSLAAPLSLKDAQAVRGLCAAIADLHLQTEEGAEPAEPATRALHAVYRLEVPATGFSLRSDSSALSVDMRKVLQAFDGQVGLTALASADSTFSVAPDVVLGVKAAAKAGTVRLDLTFTLEGTDSGVPACFTHSGGSARLLRVQPISYALIDVASKAVLARLRTSAWSELSAWVSPGEATVQVRATSGAQTLTQLQDDLRQADISACLAPLLGSPTETGMVALTAMVTKRGGLGDVRVQVDALNDAKALQCVQDKVEAATVTGLKAAATVSVEVSVDRPRDEGPEPLLLD